MPKNFLGAGPNISSDPIQSLCVDRVDGNHNAGHNQDHFDNHLVLAVVGCFISPRGLKLQHEF